MDRERRQAICAGSSFPRAGAAFVAALAALVSAGSASAQTAPREPAERVVLSFQRGGEALSLFDRRGGVMTWDLRRGRLTRREKLPSFNADSFGAIPQVTLSRDGAVAAVRASEDDVDDHQFWLVDLAGGRPIHHVSTTHAVSGLALSRDGLWAVTVSGDREGRGDYVEFDDEPQIWDTRTGKLKRKLPVETNMSDGHNCVAISPDGALVAAGGADNKARIWRVASGRRVSVAPFPRSKTHYRQMRAIRFLSDDELMGTSGGSDDKEATCEWRLGGPLKCRMTDEAQKRARPASEAAARTAALEWTPSPDGRLAAAWTGGVIVLAQGPQRRIVARLAWSETEWAAQTADGAFVGSPAAPALLALKAGQTPPSPDQRRNQLDLTK